MTPFEMLRRERAWFVLGRRYSLVHPSVCIVRRARSLSGGCRRMSIPKVGKARQFHFDGCQTFAVLRIFTLRNIRSDLI
jgi:hypothetical protein